MVENDILSFCHLMEFAFLTTADSTVAEMHHFPVITVKLLWNNLYCIKRQPFILYKLWWLDIPFT